MSRRHYNRNRLMLTTALGSALLAIIANGPVAADDDHDDRQGGRTATPIKHVIVLIGENHSFDNIYGTYQPRKGQSVSNLLSKGIVNSSGMPALNTQAQQFQINPSFPSKYFIDYHATAGKTVYATLPAPVTSAAPTAPGPAAVPPVGLGQAPFDATVPNSLLPTLAPSLEKSDLGLLRTGATDLPPNAVDTRITNATSLPNGVFQVTGPMLPYDSFSGDGVHRFFHMWQQSDCSYLNNTPDNPSGCLNDLYPFVGIARNGASGGNSMAFYNMIEGDAPVFKRLADEYTLNDNYHQAVMGGTAVQHVMIETADAIPWETYKGLTQPLAATVTNPDPKSPTNVAFKVDKQWTICSNLAQPGIPAIVNYLATLPWLETSTNPSNCQSGRYYMIDNLSPGYLPNGQVNDAGITTGAAVPPSTMRTIGDALNEKNISWAYYGGGYSAAVRVANGSTDPVDGLIAFNYCDHCNAFSFATSIMADRAQRSAHIKDAIDFFDAIEDGNLPSVAYVKPDGLVDGHPATSKLSLFEAMVENIVDKLKAHPHLFKETALFVTVDEAGGYWDSGFIQPLDFFGDGPRIPLLVISPYARGGNVRHSYNDHVSVIKFIERNWGLGPLTTRSRDNLRNPVMSHGNPYVPMNMPAIGDLFDMFDFD